MLPIMNNSYPLYYNHSSSFATSENNNNSFQHHQDLHSSYYSMLSNIIPPNSENPFDTLLSSEAPNNQFSSMNKQISSKRANSKRDTRHTKICTAQGVRDRRVRLSFNIARDFFNLQDMLGFDKASKTLGWLLEKSKVDIQELAMTINKRNNNETNNIEARTIEEIDEDEDEEHEEQVLNTKGSSKKYGKQKKCVDQSDEKAIRRTNRAKARERARERTKTKKTINDHNSYIHLESSIHHQNDQQQGGYQHNMLLPHSISCFTTPSSLISHGMNKGISVGESIVLKSNNSRETTSLNYNNYDMITKDNNYPLGYYNYHNDHLNKFEFGSLPSLNVINLSTEIHINTNPWD